MSILIRGMEMPTDCAMMLKIFPDGRVGVPVHLNWAGTMVVKDVEAVPVSTPHGRLIDADALKFSPSEFWGFQATDNAKSAEAIVNDAPTVIEPEEET